MPSSGRGSRVGVVLIPSEVWSLYGAPWSQPVATAGKCRCGRNRKNKRKPLPWIATGCVRRSMVRRGSPVRVRKRALTKAPQTGFSSSRLQCTSSSVLGYGTGFGTARQKRLRFRCLIRHQADQEDFLVVSGEAVLIIEGEERQILGGSDVWG